MKTHLDLFSGIGGFKLAAEWAGFETIGFSEVEPYACKLLADKWPNIKNYGDIKELDGKEIGTVDLVTGGFPCQPFSVAGKQRGKNDDRHLWPEMFRVIQECKPTWVLGENVAGLINMELEACILDLEREGYEVQPLTIPACAVSANHRRDRVWIVGYSKHNGSLATEKRRVFDETKGGIEEGQEQTSKPKGASRSGNGEDVGDPQELHSNASESDREDSSAQIPKPRSADSSDNVADSDSERLPGQGSYAEPINTEADKDRQAGGIDYYGEDGEAAWIPEPLMDRVANGIPNQSHRLKGLGNAIVPQVAYEILKGMTI